MKTAGSHAWWPIHVIAALLGVQPAQASLPGDACIDDIEALTGFLQANDAGAQQPVAPIEQALRDAALKTARGDARSAQDDAQCAAVVRTYLRAWRKGHLSVQPTKQGDASETPSEKPRLPSLELLSPRTALIVIPSFAPSAREPLAALLGKERRRLESRPNWIVDVRGNDGGSDATYAPLLPWLMSDGWIEVSEKVFVTPSNLRAEESVCDLFAPGDAECVRIADATVRRMRSVPAGSWVEHEYEQGWQYRRSDALERRRPARIAVLMDSRCASTCEQFLLTVKQAFGVKLVGHGRSYGALDASNLRPYPLPSGQRTLWYATTLSNRLPRLPVDGVGIGPDVYLPDAENLSDRSVDVKRTQRWLERGGW
jgi:hypothetical protein